MRELDDRQEAIRRIAQEADGWRAPSIARQRRRRKSLLERIYARLLGLILRPTRRD